MNERVSPCLGAYEHIAEYPIAKRDHRIKYADPAAWVVGFDGPGGPSTGTPAGHSRSVRSGRFSTTSIGRVDHSFPRRTHSRTPPTSRQTILRWHHAKPPHVCVLSNAYGEIFAYALSTDTFVSSAAMISLHLPTHSPQIAAPFGPAIMR
jgi:hypothetical protein